MARFLPVRQLLLVILPAAAILWFYSFLWVEAPFSSSDSARYIAVARDLTDFRLDSAHVVPPGLAPLLLLTHSTESATRPFFVLSLCLYGFGLLLFQQTAAKAGIPVLLQVCGVLLLLLPCFVARCTFALAENTCGVLLVAAVWAITIGVERRRLLYFALAGLALGWCAITHPIYQFVGGYTTVVLLAVGLLLRRTRINRRLLLSAGAVILVISSLPVVAVMSYNQQKFGFFGLSCVGGFALSTKTAKFIERAPEKYGEIRKLLIETRDRELVEGKSHTAGSYIWKAREPLIQSTGKSNIELSSLLTKLNLDVIKAAPGSYLFEVTQAGAGFWAPNTAGVATFDSRILQACWLSLDALLSLAFWLTAFTFLTAEVLIARRKVETRSSLAIPWQSSRCAPVVLSLCLALPVYVSTIVAFFGLPEFRYRQPVSWLVVMASIVGLYWGCHFLGVLPDESVARLSGGPQEGKRVASQSVTA